MATVLVAGNLQHTKGWLPFPAACTQSIQIISLRFPAVPSFRNRAPAMMTTRFASVTITLVRVRRSGLRIRTVWMGFERRQRRLAIINHLVDSVARILNEHSGRLQEVDVKLGCALLLKAAIAVLMLPVAIGVLIFVYALLARPTGPVIVRSEPHGLAATRGPNHAILISAGIAQRRVASIDVFAVPPGRLGDALRDAERLLLASSAHPGFASGVLFKGLPKHVQPLDEFGFVPNEAWVAIYAIWDRQQPAGHGATPEGRAVLRRMSSYAPWAATILAEPARSLYVPTLVDGSGELCNHRSCKRGDGVGPLIDTANSRATFINIFETTPDRQDRLLDTTYAIMPVARQHPGYLRTALHRSLDGTRVANVGQYETYRQIGDMYYHLGTLNAFGSVFIRDVTQPLFCILGACIGDYPRLRTYSVERIVGGTAVAPLAARPAPQPPGARSLGVDSR